MLVAYFALPELGIRLGKLESFVVSLALYAGAYLTEVFRASLIGIPAGLTDAGLSIGLTRLQVARLIRLPIMLRNALPALGSTFISLFKDTSIAAAIADARADLPGAPHQRRQLPRGRGLDGGERALRLDVRW